MADTLVETPTNFQTYAKAEIKPREPKLLNKVLTENERRQKPVDYLIVCGQGPVLDPETGFKPDPENPNAKADAISWMKTIARAAGEMKTAGMTKKIILSGGKTGGPNFPSEAELMKKILEDEYQLKEGVDFDIDSKSKNTLENFGNSLNLASENGSFGFLGANFHLSRIRLIADLFGMDSSNAFSAEQIMRLIGERTSDDKLLNLLDARLNPNSPRIIYKPVAERTPSEKPITYFDQFPGEEGKGLRTSKLDQAGKPTHTRFDQENLWSETIVKHPDYWIGYLGLDQSNVRLLHNLHRIDEATLKELGIINPDKTIDTTDIEEIRKSLESYRGEKRFMPTKEQAQEIVAKNGASTEGARREKNAS